MKINDKIDLVVSQIQKEYDAMNKIKKLKDENKKNNDQPIRLSKSNSIPKYISPRIAGHSADYDLFKLNIRNRALNKKHIAKLVQSMKANGNISSLTCREITIENKKYFEIIDGQHRFEALKIIGLPVEFDCWSLDNKAMIALNENQKNWTLEDYLHFGVEDGIEDYVYLNEWRRKTGVTLGGLLEIFAPVAPPSYELKGHKIGINQTFKNLSWRIQDKAQGEKILSCLQDFYFKLNVGHWNNKRFISAFIDLYKNPAYDHIRMLEQLKKEGNALHKQSSKAEYIKNFINAYNYQVTSIGKIIFGNQPRFKGE